MSLKQITLLFFALAALFVTSCDKEDISSDHKITSFVATLSGADWQAATSHAVINDTTDLITVYGENNDFSVELALTGTGKGHFNLDDLGNDMIIKSATKEYHYLNGTEGVVELTLNDKVDFALSGEFSGMLVDTTLDTLIVEGGKFTHILYLDSVGSGNPGSTGLCGTNMIAASVDGNAIGLSFLGASNLVGIIQVIGSNGTTNENLQLVFPEDIAVGSYDFNASNPLGTYTKTEGTTAANYNSTSGTLVIVEHDTANKYVKGTFSFTATEIGGTATKTISDGSFCVKYN